MSKSRRKRHRPEQIVKKLRDAMLSTRQDLATVLQALEVSEATCLAQGLQRAPSAQLAGVFDPERVRGRVRH